jgi:hypothetical protein
MGRGRWRCVSGWVGLTMGRGVVCFSTAGFFTGWVSGAVEN